MYLEYPSSVDSGLRLFAEFIAPREPRPLLVVMHGWHGQVKQPHKDNVAVDTGPAEWFSIAPEMRGRGDATGKPDCNGWELQDVVDAVAYARQEFAHLILDPDRVTLTGGSGGGGNVFGLLGKFPDTFCRARAECGISDYALFSRNDAVGEFRDEMDIWIGLDPDTDPERYASRSGVTTAGNLLTPLIVFHGELDARVPAEHSRRYVRAAREAGKSALVTYRELKGVGASGGHYGGIRPTQEAYRERMGRSFLGQPSGPVEIPARGRFVVAGYLKISRFEVVLESIDRVGTLAYDLSRDAFSLAAARPLRGILRVRTPSGWQERRVETQPCNPVW